MNSLRTAEDLALNLEMRVHQREQEIQQQFFQLQKLRSEQILSDERVRIMRDMHDGIGSQLVAIVSSLLPSSDAKMIDVRERIKLCINDLRLVIDSLDPTLNDIGVLLGTLRSRLEGQLKTAGIALNWDIQTLPEWAHNTPQENLHILRLLQEAITNAIKHSQCTHITLRAYSDPSHKDTVHIEIIDNGIGFQGTTSKRSGYGLENMRHRAKQIGADFCIENTGHGTCCRLALKMPKTAHEKTSTYA